MTIVFGGRAILFAEPSEADMKLFAQMQHARAKWEQEGRPTSNQGFW